MNAHYKVEADPVTNVVRHYLGGFFEAADVERYVAARNAAHLKLTSAPNQHVTLVDVRDMKIQPQEMVPAFAAMMSNPQYRSRKLAFVVSLSLARMQLVRASEGRAARFFTDMDEAEAWLMSHDDEAAEPPFSANDAFPADALARRATR